jgi:restriction endonuclease-like protein
MTVVESAKRALWRAFPGRLNASGYAESAQENLVAGVEFSRIESDLRRGDGNELEGKFKAAHSSSALAVNSFGPFKVHPEQLSLLDHHGATNLEFERRFPIFRGGRAPNLDVWAEFRDSRIAVESKLLEYLTPKMGKFSAAYDRLEPHCESCWWRAYEHSQRGAAQYLDRAQLLKHYFGLNAHRRKNGGRVTLLYLFWEPLNWESIPECVQHRAEVVEFADGLAGSEIPFRWSPYRNVWEQWETKPSLAQHVANIRSRYDVAIPGDFSEF